MNLYQTNPEIKVLRAKSLLLGEAWLVTDVIPLLIEAQRTSSGYQKLEAHFWHGVALWEDERFPESLIAFSAGKEMSLSMGRSDVKDVRYISGMCHGTPKLYEGRIIELTPRCAWILCIPGGTSVFANPGTLAGYNKGDSIAINIGFNLLGPIVRMPSDRIALAEDAYL